MKSKNRVMAYFGLAILSFSFYSIQNIYAASTCVADGGSCGDHMDCCSVSCDLSTNPGKCKAAGVNGANGGACKVSSECQSNNCVSNVCAASIGNGGANGSACKASTECQSNNCVSNICASAAGNGGSNLKGTGIDIPTNTGLPNKPIKDILENLLRWLLGVVGVIALIGFVISGIQYVISTGDDSKMETAKNNMMYSIIGVIVALAGFVIIQAIDFALRAKSF